MEFAIDLHIHSALSPCGDRDMTPNNIVNMCILKGIDIFSVTDHNSAANLPPISKVAMENGIMLLPGLEVQTKEEIHLLCYFKNVEQALDFGNIIYETLPSIANDEALFGEQLLMDHEDNVVGKMDKLLLSSCDISVNELFKIVKSFDGVCVPAHVDKSAYSIISNLGFIPKNICIKTVEISKNITESAAISRFPYLKDYRIIKSSDSHYLFDIAERENFISLEYLSLTNILYYLKGL